MNRQALKLADCDGQIWAQLISINGGPDCIKFGKGNKGAINKKLAAALQLDGQNITRLPSRLLVIARNEQWNDFTTSWCRTAIGRETFNASKWVNMISHRLDYVNPPPFHLLTLTAHLAQV